MLSKTVTTVGLMLCLSVPVDAQPVTSSIEGLYELTKLNVMRTADIVDEELYSYRPTDDVRTIGQLLAHIADAQYIICSAAAGGGNPATERFEQARTTKAEIIEALDAAFAYCDSLFDGLTDESGARPVEFFTGPNTVLGLLAFNAAHNFEHYGNLVTYMRMNGIVPPSSR